MTTRPDPAPPVSRWSPLRHSLFRWLWIASVVMPQHERVSVADRLVEEAVLAFVVGGQRPVTRHLVAATGEAPGAGLPG